MAHLFPSRSVPQVTSFTSPLGRSRGMRRFATLRSALPLWLGLICVLLVALAGCGGTSGSGGSNAPVTGGTLNVGLTSDVVTLDPLKSTALVDREVILNIYDTLVRVDEKNAVQPDLASSWSYTSPTQLVFTLRSDVKFQDGTPSTPTPSSSTSTASSRPHPPHARASSPRSSRWKPLILRTSSST